MAVTRNPTASKQRADHIADLISEACEKLVELATDWFELNDKESKLQAQRMLNANEVTLMLSARVAASGLSHIALNLLRTETPMPHPFFEIRVPMQPWTLGLPEVQPDASEKTSTRPGGSKAPRG